MKGIRSLVLGMALLLAAAAPAVWACDDAVGCNDYKPDVKEFIRLACDGPNCDGEHHIDVRGVLKLASWDCPPNLPPALCDQRSVNIEDVMKLACNNPNCLDDFRKELKGLKKLACNNPNCDDEYRPDMKGVLKLACDNPNCTEDYAPKLPGFSRVASAPKDMDMAAGVISKSIGPSTAAKQEAKPKYTLDDKAIKRLQAAEASDFPVITAFLNKRIPINAKDSKGNTLLFYMASAGDPERVKTLLDKGADPLCKNADGCTPLSCAKAKGHKEVVALLEKAIVK